MTLGEKIYKLRTEHGMSQEAFGDTLGVSRQSVSKWETDQSQPELDKIIAISEMFTVSTDYLLKERQMEESAVNSFHEGEDGNLQSPHIIVQKPSFHYEYKSERTFMGLPLVHINIGFKPVRAKGIIAIGNAAQGIIAIGIAGVGIITLAPVGVGLLLAIGCVVTGGVALGTIAVGVIAMGALCCGLFTMGAVAIGQFSYGALALGSQIAIGDVARGNIALGLSEAAGGIYEEVRAADGSFDYQAIIAVIDANVPGYWHVFTSWMKAIIRMMVGSGRIMP